MSNEELAIAIQTGDREKLLDLWEGVRDFAWQQSYRWFSAFQGSHGVTCDNLIQTTFLVLMDATDRFSPESGSFITLYALRLKTAFSVAYGIRTRRMKMDPLQTASSIDAPLFDGDGEPFTLSDTLKDPDAEQEFRDVDERIWEKQRREAVENALQALPPEELEIIRARYYRRVPFAKLGPSAHLMHNRAMKKLRSHAVKSRLREFVDLRTPYYLHVGLEAFQRTGESAVERVVFFRERLQEEQNPPS